MKVTFEKKQLPSNGNIILIVDEVRVYEYITSPITSISSLGLKLGTLHIADMIILLAGFVGAVLAGVANKILRSKGYRMF